MTEAWVQLRCPECGETWEANPAELPAPGERFACGHCGDERPIAEFMRTGRSLEILESFHGG
jgi:predicted RNA-binding Zn-ribbon protein involved in translation (DUF1610 family)